ncbi:MAG: Spy/CpxP family protein refolding chaperone [Betaproteobacteria bacterium]|nr:Spy/CpxP family protein refolding chaperone [Betaproteobacteria bacterium]
MKRTIKLVTGIGMAVTLGLAAAAAGAQPYGYGPRWGAEGAPAYGGGYGPGMGRGMGPMMGRGMGPGAFGNPTAATEGRLAYLKSELKISSTQETAWQAYADQVKQQAETRQAWRNAPPAVPASAPERMALRTEQMKKNVGQMEETTAAFKDLYAALTPEQKTLADQRLGGFGPGWHRGPGGRFR